ncbi:hypothetical protein ANO11243_014040 [Dothideomycetidae sp. 11243]|nr:hypothetical protein ANO11243_014040 [fungal sp. No.11243]
MEQVIPVDNETVAEFSRTTRDGRKLTYKLNVLQQPEKARACGSGAKSSADRRPVDPPPIVELKIFEGENADTDITFTMNANYFLFVTLEQARPIAQGRVPQDHSRTPVLTGTPVSGLVYLDRPHPAGYFLFPDLSVRHEGKYRLSFNLYEELKEEKDQDKVVAKDDKPTGIGAAHVTHRLAVKSRPFIVYSAKKFPGLNQSTELSRTVAEQGCRVRIRRDARVRKRGKHGQDTDCGDEPGGDIRQRSSSVDSHRSIAPAISRRPSEQTLGHQYDQGPSQGRQTPLGGAPGIPPAAYGQEPAPQYQTPYHQGVSYSQTAMAPPQHVRQSSYPYSYQHSGPHPPFAGHGLHGSAGYPGPVTSPAPMHSQPTGQPNYQFRPGMSEARHGQPSEYQSASNYATAPGYRYPAGPTHAQSHQIPPPSHVPVETSYHNHNSVKDASPPYNAQYHTGSVATHRMLPAISTANQIPSRLLEPASPASAGPSPVFSDGPRTFHPRAEADSHASISKGKRSYGQVFDTMHMDGPLRGGARPVPGVAHGHHSSLHVDPDEAAEDAAAIAAGLRMSYKRADGRQITKSLPFDH